MPAPRADLERLLHKYRTLHELRRRREEVHAAGGDRFDAEEGAVRRAAFRSLAAEFPGSLRELDVTPAAALSVRLSQVEAALAGGEAATWIEVAAAYHQTLREALAVKRWLAARRPRGGVVDDELVSAFRAWRTGQASEGDLRGYLERHLRPPGGRLHALVWVSLQARFGLEAAALEAILFGSPR